MSCLSVLETGGQPLSGGGIDCDFFSPEYGKILRFCRQVSITNLDVHIIALLWQCWLNFKQ